MLNNHLCLRIAASGFLIGMFRRGIFLIVALLGLCMSARAGDASSIVLDEKNITLNRALELIEQQSGYHFVYNKNVADFNRPVSVRLNDLSIEAALDHLFTGRSIKYEIDDKYVILHAGGDNTPAAEMTVKGNISDADGEPLMGASVLVKGTATRVVADFDGNYSIAAHSGDVLVFTYIGCEPKEIKVGSQSVVDVVLESSETLLNEVVVIGYGTVKKQDLTGSVSSISSATITDRKQSMLSNALQGAMSGVTVTRSGSGSGSSADVLIRGITTIGDSSPLIIVDGVPADNLNDINPQDVESLTVLKDGASAAIYGSRAAAGVILITTKRASDGKVSMSYSYEYGYEKPTTQPDYVDVKRYMAMTNELRWNDSGNGSEHFPTYIQAVIDNYDELHANAPDSYPDTDWRGMLMKNHSNRQSHNFRISGGTARIRTNASIGYDYADGLYAHKDYARFTARMNNDIRINDWISAAFDVNVKRSTGNDPAYNPMYASYIMPQVYAARWADGTNYIRIPVNTPRFTVSAAKDYKLVSVKTGDRDLTITDNEAVVECTPTSVITITSMHINTGIGEIAADGIAEPVYYNLTGNRVFNPVKGSLYIVVTGNQVRKIIL